MPVHLAKPLQILIGIWEVALVSIIVWRVARAIRKSRAARAETQAQDAFYRLRSAARATFPFRRVADAIGYEMAVTAYALFGADRKLALPGQAFSYHRKNGYGAIVSGLMIAMIAETAGVHLLLVHFRHPRIALLLTVLSLYGTLWFLGDYQAARRRPIRIEADRLAIRTGLRWNLDVPFAAIDRIEPIHSSPSRKAEERSAPPCSVRRCSCSISRSRWWPMGRTVGWRGWSGLGLRWMRTRNFWRRCRAESGDPSRGNGTG